MIGKIILMILMIAVVLLLVLLLIPVSLRVSYRDTVFGVTVRYGSKEIVLYPRPVAGDTPKKEKPEKKTTGASAETKKKEKPKVNWDQISYSLDVLPRVLLRALRRTARRIQIMPLKIHLLVATSDPADTALLYGKLQGVLAAILPPLHCAVRIRDQDIQLFPDFCEESMDVIADVGLRIRPWDVLVVALFAAGGLVKWYFGFRKRADKHPDEQKRKKKKMA